MYRINDREDIYDFTWSPQGQYLIIGCTDNSLVFWDAQQGKILKSIKEHSHFVQGLCWDPFEEVFVSQSSDRSVKVFHYKWNSKGSSLAIKCCQTLSKWPYCELFNKDEHTEDEIGKILSKRFYDDETLVSFFRRLDFTPDGSLLITPTGILPKANEETFNPSNNEANIHYVFIYTRASLLR